MKSTSRLARVLGFRPMTVALFTVWLGLGLLSPARASVLMAMDLETLTNSADHVLVGTVEKVESHYLSPASRYIVTDVTVRSERNLLGVPEGTRFVVRKLGGAVGELGQLVHGEASYQVGEQVLLFASERQGAFYAVGMAQGALHIYRDSAGVQRVGVDLAGAELSGPALAAAPSGRTLDEVVSQVQGYLSRRPTQSQKRSQ